MAAASRQWHVLGGGALGCLWSARMTRAGQKVSLILKNQSWEEMASPMTAKINVSNHFNLRCQGWQADIALEPVAASTAIRRLLVGYVWLRTFTIRVCTCPPEKIDNDNTSVMMIRAIQSHDCTDPPDPVRWDRTCTCDKDAVVTVLRISTAAYCMY